MCDSSAFCTFAYKRNGSNTDHGGETGMEGEIQTASAGRLWGAYLMTVFTLLQALQLSIGERVQKCDTVVESKL